MHGQRQKLAHVIRNVSALRRAVIRINQAGNRNDASLVNYLSCTEFILMYMCVFIVSTVEPAFTIGDDSWNRDLIVTRSVHPATPLSGTAPMVRCGKHARPGRHGPVFEDEAFDIRDF